MAAGRRDRTRTPRAGARRPGAHSGSGGSAGHTGHGLAGLRERAEALHGRVEAGPSPGGGFRLVVSVPVSVPISRAVESGGIDPVALGVPGARSRAAAPHREASTRSRRRAE